MKRIRNKKGFTMTELLCATAILLLVGAVAVSSLQLGINSFRDLVRESEAQLLCSTLSTSVNQELRFARAASVTDGGQTSYTDSRGHISSFTQDGAGRVLLRGEPLLSERSYPLGLQAQVTLEYSAADKLITANVTVSYGGSELAGNRFRVAPVNMS